MRTSWAIGVVLCMWFGGCVEAEIAGENTPDAGGLIGRDGGTPSPDDGGLTPPTPEPGEVALAIDLAQWSDGTRTWGLEVRLTLANGDSGAPAPQNPALFSLETTGGALVTGTRSGLSDPCSPTVSVAPGAALQCSLVFDLLDLPEGHQPLRVHYAAPDGRSASAPIVGCGSDGVCFPGATCDGGRCRWPCEWGGEGDDRSGYCARAGDLCVDRTCVSPCAPTAPDGYCEAGECVGGRCDTSCWSVDSGAEGCSDCLIANSSVCEDALGGGEGTCATPIECGNCLGYGGSSCDCPTRPECLGCDALIGALYDCVEALCPVCISSGQW